MKKPYKKNLVTLSLSVRHSSAQQNKRHQYMYLKQGEFPFGAAARDSRSRIHERTISLRFLGISVLRLEVSVWISLTIGNGVWFSIRFSSFLLYSEQ